MPLGMQATKRRIRSVSSTRKITKAMELVATSKLRRVKERYAQVHEYTDEVIKIVGSILNSAKNVESKYFKSNNAEGTLYLVVTSTMGLCGGYNSNVIKALLEEYDQEKDKLIMVGLKGVNNVKHRGIETKNAYTEDSTNREYEQAHLLALEALHLYEKGEVAKIKIIYTRFVNSVTFQPVILDLLPINPDQIQIEKQKESVETLFEPSAEVLLDELIPMYFESTIYGKLVEAHVSEQASRRMAMENASDNADEITESLLLQYNKARQSAITQEITEVVSGANAL